jgi:hypothetical protein
VTDTEPDRRTRIAAALADEDRRNWGYDHGFEPDDAETLAFADAAIAVVRGELAEQAATIARYDTALIEATRDLDRARRHIADLDGQIEGQDQALAAADEDRDRLAAENERLRTDRDRMHLALARERHERAEAAEWPEEDPEPDPDCTTATVAGPEPLPLYPPRVEWIVQAYEPERFGEEWEQIRSPYRTPEAAHADAARWRALPGLREVRVLGVESTYRLDASRAPESPADAPDPSNDPRSG